MMDPIDYGNLKKYVHKLLTDQNNTQGIFSVIDECGKRFQGDYLAKKLSFLCLAAILVEQNKRLDGQLLTKILRFSDELDSGKYQILFDDAEEKLIRNDLKRIKKAMRIPK